MEFTAPSILLALFTAVIAAFGAGLLGGDVAAHRSASL